MTEKELPRILYISDVPVELSYAGATLIYRLLEYYPKDKLLIVQGGEVNEKRRIPGVQYIVVKSRLNRLKFTRFSKFGRGLIIAGQLVSFRKSTGIIRSFKPDMILTVSIQLMWVKALKLSKKLNIPFHVILHDDWLTTEDYGVWSKYLTTIFEKMYRHASGRFCISRTMEEYYYSLYAVHGQVLYPFRGKYDREYPVTESKGRDKLKYCYAGSLFTGDFPFMLNELSLLIERQHGELHIFSHKDKVELAKYEHLGKVHVIFHGLLHPSDLMKFMNEEIDVAILLNSFITELPFRYNFSSKLVDYSSAGLPVLFWGSPSSGAISWAMSMGYEAIVTSRETSELEKLVQRFENNEQRIRWAKQIKEWGASQFGYDSNYRTFINQITG